MNELIKITEKNGIKTVNARELFIFLESKQEFTAWIKNRIEKYGFVKEKDFLIILSESTGGRPATEYHLSIDMAKELSMVENNDKGRQARQYFIECERRLNKNYSNMTRLEILEMALQAEKERIEVENKLLKSETRISLLIHNSKTYTATEIAKELNMKSANELNKWLESKNVQYKINGTWVLTAEYSDCNYTSIKQEELDNGKIIYNRHWTGAGRDFILSQFSTGVSEI